jgi:GTP-binding protein Era
MEESIQGTGTGFRAGYVAVMGRPNVGKSTLMNALLGQKVAAVSPRPQTTRRRQLGIFTNSSSQVIFIDTPGVHKARYKLGEMMNEVAAKALEESDAVLFVVDASEPPTEEDQILAKLLSRLRRRAPVVLALNKADLVPGDQLEARTAEFLELVPQADPLAVSAVQGMNLEKLVSLILERLPVHDPFFPEEQITDLYERDIAADLIREAALVILREEIPHGITVRVDEFTERGEQGAYIAATIFVERESHKGIVIGENGQMLKRIGSAARHEIETMSGRSVYLELRVKVRKNWRNDPKSLRQFGFGEND